MTPRWLRPIGKDDYAVIEDGAPVGRIRRAGERRGEIWMWNVTVNIPGANGGTASDLAEAKRQYLTSWRALAARVDDGVLMAAIVAAQAARDRFNG